MSKIVRVATQKAISAIKSAEFYVTDVEISNLEELEQCARTVHQKKPKASFLLMCAAPDSLLVAAAGPERSDFDFGNWIRYVSTDFHNPLLTHGTDVMTANIPKEDNGSPVIMLENARSKAFEYLRNESLLEEESEEDFIGFDDI